MLSYHTYFETLATLGDPTHPDWQSTAAGLAVLRLVNDWLDFGKDTDAVDSASIAAVKQMIEQIPKTKKIKPVLSDLLRTLDHFEYPTLPMVTQPLLVYAQHLHYDGKYTLAKETLVPLLRRAECSRDTSTQIAVALRLATTTRLAGDIGSAEEYYQTAIRGAQLSGDKRIEVMGKCGYGKVVVVRGDLSQAESLYADLAAEVEKAGNSMFLPSVLHEQAYLADICSDTNRSILLMCKAIVFKDALSRHSLEALQADLAAILSDTAEPIYSQRQNLILATSAGDKAVRTQAIESLMCSAIYVRDRQLFDFYRSAPTLTTINPWTKIGFHRDAARGLRAFGDFTGAHQELQKAHATAIAHQIHTQYAQLD